MPGRWDTSTKRLIGENPAHFIQWLLPGATLIKEAVSKPLNLNNREIEADNLFEILLNGHLCSAHFELQTSRDETMARRMWEYNALATFSYNRPTYSCVIYLKKCQVTEPFYIWRFPNGEVIHSFSFKVVELWKISPETIKQTKLAGLFPLMVLAQDGKQPAVVEEIISSVRASGEPSAPELLSLTYILASLVFEKEADHIWLKRRFGMLRDVLRDTWAYQEIMQEGREEGLQLGIQEGRQEGLQEGRQEGRQEGLQQRLKDQRQILMTIIQAHFPDLVTLAKKQMNEIQDPDMLQQMVLQLLVAQSGEQAQEVLVAVSSSSTASGKKKRNRHK
ncbi:MAG: Rpn family recombination-promoting nuclease/putative transposase [Ktedonobacteraceae bacterium]